jgi:cobalt-precorrin-5B (C1)-methyltransferase
VLDGVWDTHSSKSNMAMGGVARVAAECGVPAAVVQEMENANTVEAAIDILKTHPVAQQVWTEIEQRIATLAQQRMPAVKRVEVRLFDLAGNQLGAGA